MASSAACSFRAKTSTGICAREGMMATVLRLVVVRACSSVLREDESTSLRTRVAIIRKILGALRTQIRQ